VLIKPFLCYSIFITVTRRSDRWWIKFYLTYLSTYLPSFVFHTPLHTPLFWFSTFNVFHTPRFSHSQFSTPLFNIPNFPCCARSALHIPLSLQYLSNLTKRICVDLFRIQNSRPSCGKTYLHWVRFVFKITGHQSVNNCFPCRLPASPLTETNIISPY